MAETRTELSIAIRAKDEASRTLDKLEKQTSSLTDKFQKHGRAIGMAFTAAGAAGLKMIDSAREMNAQLGVTAIGMGVTTEDMRKLALEATNVTFPLEEVTASFDMLTRAGVKDMEVLKATATAFDTLGDAIGMGAGRITELMIPAMKTFGLSADQMAKKVDMMTYLARETTMTIDDFNTMVGYTTPELVEMGLTMEDLTAILVHMEQQGFAPGRVMTREFQKAVTLATKEQISLTEAIGITSEELEGYKQDIAGATGLTAEYADEANKQYGMMDKVKQKFSELTLELGSFLTPFEGIFAGMTALGPIMMILSTSVGISTVKWAAHTIALVASKVAMVASTVALKAVTVAQWLWNAALTANPIGLIVMAIAGLVAGVILLIKNWDKVTAAFKVGWEWIKNLWTIIKTQLLVVWDKLVEGLKKVGEWFTNLKDTIIDLVMNAINWLIDKFNALIAPFKTLYGWISKLISGSGFTELNSVAMDTIGIMGAVGNTMDTLSEKMASAKGYVDSLTTQFNSLKAAMPERVTGGDGGPMILGRAATVAANRFGVDIPTPAMVQEMMREARELGVPGYTGYGLESLGLPRYHGGIESVPRTGPAIVEQGETILKRGTTISIPIYIGEELIETKIAELVGSRVNLQGVA